MGKIIRGDFNPNLKMRNKTTAIIAAGGKGTRMGLDFNKIFLSVDSKPILAYTLDVFEAAPSIDSIVLVCSQEDMSLCQEIVSSFGYTKVKHFIKGGSTRQESVRNGLMAISPACDIVIVHDAARPLVTQELIDATIQAANTYGAAAVAVSPVDTVKRINGSIIAETVDRNSLVLIQTPQAFRYEILKKAHENALRNHQLATDDCALAEMIGQTVTVIPGNKSNIKLTTPEDYAIISAYLSCYRGMEDTDDD